VAPAPRSLGPDGKRQHSVAEIAESVGVHRTTVRPQQGGRRQAAVNAALQDPEQARTTIVPLYPAARAAPIASAAKLTAPRAVFALRPRDIQLRLEQRDWH